MIIEHSGWKMDKGFFCDKYFVDENKTDYEIKWKNGRVCKQLTPFHSVTADWNCDGDVYESFGANFENKWSTGRDWITPQTIVNWMLEGEITVEGIRRI